MAYITLDFETYYATRYSLGSLSYEEYIFNPCFRVHGVGIKINNEPTVYHPCNDVDTVLRELFTPGNDHTLICHNLMFDGAILSWVYGLGAARYWCTQAMSRGLFPQMSSSLQALAERLWPDDPTMRKGTELENFKGVWDLTPEQQEIMGGYCIQDVELTFHAALKMHAMLPDEELESIDWAMHQFVHPVLNVDRSVLEQFLLEHRAAREAAFAASGTTREILASNMKFAAWLLQTHGIEVSPILSPTPKDPENTKLPLSKADREFIDLQLNRPDLEHVWVARKMATSNIAETRAERILRHSELLGGKLAIPIGYYAAHTGRYGGTNKINMQNFQSKSAHRRSLKAPPGYLIGVRDLANIEGRLSAWFAGQWDKCEAFASGEDLYNRLASAIYGRPVDRKRKETGPDGKEFYPDETPGFVGKTCELGLGYRMGAPKLRHTFLVGGRNEQRVFFSLEECKKFVTTYRALNDKIAECWATGDRMIHHMTQAGEEPLQWRCLEVGYRYIKLPNGMYLTYPNLRAVEDERGSISYVYWNGKHDTHIHGGKLMENIIQALARIIMEHGRRLISRELAKQNDPNVRVVMTVHDEIVAVLRKDRAEKDWKMMDHCMRQLPDWANDGRLVLATDGGIDVCYSK